MNDKYGNTERGQAIVYLVIGLVVFLGFVALAIDGGMAFADKRNSQNAADAASLAGGGAAAYDLEMTPSCYAEWNCDEGNFGSAKSAAVDRAGYNHYTISDSNTSGHNDVQLKCGLDVLDTGYKDKYLDVTVEISSTTKSNFAQLLFPSALHNEVDAVTRVHPQQPVGFGNAIVALNPAPCSGNENGINIQGTSDTLVEGGGIFSNGCLSGGGSFTATISGTVALPVGHEVIPGDLDNWDPDPRETEVSITSSDLGIEVPDCSDPDAHNINASQLKGEIAPGLYCVSGNVNLQGSHAMLHGTGVTIVLLNGSFTTNGNADIELSSMTATHPAIPQLTIYLPPTNHNMVKLNGNELSFYEGLVYAPGSTIMLDGTGDTIFTHSQVIGWNVKLSGTAFTKVLYDGCKGYVVPTSLELSK